MSPDALRHSMPGRLNLFQRTMLQWDALHPYNAVHVVRVPIPFRRDQAEAALGTVLERRGLTHLRLDPKRGTFHYGGGPAPVDLTVLDTPPQLPPPVAAEIERQLNTRFDTSASFTPFRFFAAPAGDTFLLGLVYFHAVADADSIVHLLREMVETVLGGAPEGASTVPDLHPASPDHVLRDHPGVVWNRLRHLPGFIHTIRHSSRPPYRNPGDFTNGFRLFRLDGHELQALVTAGRRLGVTIHDLLLALLFRALARLEPARRRTGRRRLIALGSIVNTRKDHGIDGRRSFGLFLGSFVIGLDAGGSEPVSDLALHVHARTSGIKERRLYLGMPLELAAVRRILSFYSTDRRDRFYQKHFPLWGGITNMNLNSIWTQPPGGRPLEYFRGVSTGPATPLVLSVTTAHESVYVGVSHRQTVFTRQEMDQLEHDLRDAVRELEEAGTA